jgi:uncharacterized C2H2 Zn-finger protein
VIKKGEHVIRFPTAGRVVVISKDDKRINCSHEDKILYCVRDGYRFYWCNLCKNLVREEIKRGDGNE